MPIQGGEPNYNDDKKKDTADKIKQKAQQATDKLGEARDKVNSKVDEMKDKMNSDSKNSKAIGEKSNTSNKAIGAETAMAKNSTQGVIDKQDTGQPNKPAAIPLDIPKSKLGNTSANEQPKPAANTIGTAGSSTDKSAQEQKPPMAAPEAMPKPSNTAPMMPKPIAQPSQRPQSVMQPSVASSTGSKPATSTASTAAAKPPQMPRQIAGTAIDDEPNVIVRYYRKIKEAIGRFCCNTTDTVNHAI